MSSSKHIPVDKVNLRLILVSGKTKEFLFSPEDSASEIAQFVLKTGLKNGMKNVFREQKFCA